MLILKLLLLLLFVVNYCSCFKNSTTSSSSSRSLNWFGVFGKKSNTGSAAGTHTSVAQPRGWASSYEHGGHHGHHHQVHYVQQHSNQNMDLYSLLGGLSFASLLGATIIFLARRNTSGRRRRRSLFDDFDEEDFSGAPPESIENIRWTGVETAKDFQPIQLVY